jgi:hypothetical protein
MAESKTKNQTKATTNQTKATTNQTRATTNQTRVAGKASAQRKPADQALQVVDVAVGAVPEAADAVTKTVDQMRDAEARSQELKSLQNRVGNLRDPSTREAQVGTLKKSLLAEIEKAEARGGDIRRQVTDQVVEQARKARERVEPLYTDRVPSAVKQRVEPAVKRVTGNRETARV